jgi:hypothetical protein
MKTVNSQQDLVALVGDILGKQSAEDCDLCSAIYVENCLSDSIGVRWMEADGNHLMHEMIEFLDTELFAATGRTFNICNNSPTEGFVMIFWEEMNDERWDRDDHKQYFIAQFESWRNNPDSFTNRPDQALVYDLLEQVLERDCSGDLWKEVLHSDYEMWYQVLRWNQLGVCAIS